MAHVSPNVVQQSFQGRNDDGLLAAATSIAAVNTAFTQAGGSPFRLRFLLEETAGGDAKNATFVLEHNINGGGWVVTSTTTPAQLTASAFVADGTAVSQLLGSGSFVTGEFDSNGTINTPVTLTSQQTEYEYCVELDSSQLSNNDSIQFRVTDSGVALAGYTNTPTITASIIATDALLANDLSSGSSVDAPAVGQEHGLNATTVSSSTSVSTPVLAEAGADDLLANDVSAVSSVGSPSVGQEQVLLAGSVSSGSSVSSPALQTPDALLANDVSAGSSVDSPALSQEHGLLASNVSSSSSIATPSISQENALLADSVGSLPTASTPSLSESNIIGSVAALGSASGVSTPSLGQAHGFSSSALGSLSSTSTPALTTEHTLLSVSITALPSVTLPSLSSILPGQDDLLAENVQSFSTVSSPRLSTLKQINYSSSLVLSAGEDAALYCAPKQWYSITAL